MSLLIHRSCAITPLSAHLHEVEDFTRYNGARAKDNISYTPSPLAKIPPIRYLHLTNANICLFGERVGLSCHGEDGNRKSECSSVQLPICANRKDSKFGIEMTKESQAKDSVREMVEEDKN